MRTKQCLTSADVKKMLAASEAEAVKNKWAVSIAIVDDGGFLLGFTRMDGNTAYKGEGPLRPVLFCRPRRGHRTQPRQGFKGA